MRKIKIVADSSANIQSLKQIDFASAPLKIMTDEREFTDDTALRVEEMVLFFDAYKGKSKTSCPGPADWLDAFGDADDIFCLTITSGLSGSYNAACIAKKMYESEHIGSRVFVIDTLSTGPEMELLIEKIEECITQNMSYEEICPLISSYQQKTGLIFMLESLKNFAANGRVSPAIARLTGLLGIRIVGKASDAGTLEPLSKCRGENASLKSICSHLQASGYQGGKIRIAHSQNLPAAIRLKNLIKESTPSADVAIRECRGLCSYYAEKGGLLVGFEI